MSVIYSVLRFGLSVVFHIKYKINVIHPENIPDMKGGYIIAANHQSNTDPPMLAAVIKGHFAFMAKEELFHGNPFFAWLIKQCGAFPVERGSGDDAPIQNSIDMVHKGRTLVIFPEGTRSKDGTIGRMKSGVVLIASKSGAPVLPVCIRYKDKRRVDVNIGKLIPNEELIIDDADRKSMRNSAKRLKDDLVALQDEIIASDPDGKW